MNKSNFVHGACHKATKIIILLSFIDSVHLGVSFANGEPVSSKLNLLLHDAALFRQMSSLTFITRIPLQGECLN